MKTLLFAISLLLSAFSTPAAEGPGSSEWLTSLPEAKTKAKATGKMILLDFTGSDWCASCIVLKREVFQTEEFARFASTNLHLVEVDFPNGKELSPAQVKANNALQDKYDVEVYPTLILLNNRGRKIATLHYEGGGPAALIAQIEKRMPKKKK